jgi:hypothetical protein
MNFIQIEHNLGLTGGSESFRKDFSLSADSFPRTLPFLNNSFLTEVSGVFGLHADEVDALYQAAALAESRPELARLLWCFHSLLYQPPPLPDIPIEIWPDWGTQLESHGYALNLLLALSGYPLARKFYIEKALPETVFHETFQDIRIWLDYARVHEGKTGVTRRIVRWLRGPFTGKLFRLGRLQFMPSLFLKHCEAYRRRDGRVYAFAGVKPVLPSGKAVSKFRKGEIREGEQALSPDAPVLFVHIPEGGPMTPAACADSFRRALDFFPRFFPETPFKGFMTVSWMLDPVWALILKADSNIVLFQNEFYCFPVPDAKSEAVWRVFGTESLDLASAPRDNSIRRAMIAHLEKGGTFKDHGGFILNTEIARYGQAPYRTGLA